jgi:TetR/AcrR family transcriptional repressor of nem operon
MKKSKTETAETRQRIIEIDAQAFKRNGIDATGVAEIMAAAGLTHGGFYRHFESKQQLVTEACAASMDQLVHSAKAAAGAGLEPLLEHLRNVLHAENTYLGGCPLIAMGSELARSDKNTRHVASQGFRELVEIIADWGLSNDPATSADGAIFTLTSMLGAVTMARIIDDPELSERILRIAKTSLVKVPARS